MSDTKQPTPADRGCSVVAFAAIVALELVIIVGAVALVATDKSIGIPVEQMPRTLNQTEEPPMADPLPRAEP